MTDRELPNTTRRGEIAKVRHLSSAATERLHAAHEQAYGEGHTWPAAGQNARSAWQTAHKELSAILNLLPRIQSAIEVELSAIQHQLDSTTDWEQQ